MHAAEPSFAPVPLPQPRDLNPADYPALHKVWACDLGPRSFCGDGRLVSAGVCLAEATYSLFRFFAFPPFRRRATDRATGRDGDHCRHSDLGKYRPSKFPILLEQLPHDQELSLKRRRGKSGKECATFGTENDDYFLHYGGIYCGQVVYEAPKETPAVAVPQVRQPLFRQPSTAARAPIATSGASGAGPC